MRQTLLTQQIRIGEGAMKSGMQVGLEKALSSLSKNFESLPKKTQVKVARAKKESAKEEEEDGVKTLIKADYWRTFENRPKPAIGVEGRGVFVPTYPVSQSVVEKLTQKAYMPTNMARMTQRATTPGAPKIVEERPPKQFRNMTEPAPKDEKKLDKEQQKIASDALSKAMNEIFKR